MLHKLSEKAMDLLIDLVPFALLALMGAFLLLIVVGTYRLLF